MWNERSKKRKKFPKIILRPMMKQELVKTSFRAVQGDMFLNMDLSYLSIWMGLFLKYSLITLTS